MVGDRVAVSLAVGLLLMLLPGFLAAQIATADADAEDIFLVDSSSGDRFRLKLSMVEFEAFESNPGSQGGIGSVAMFLRGPGANVRMACSVHGSPGSSLDFDLFPNDPGLPFPLQNLQCGAAGGQTVVIAGCVARTSFHGFVHSDHRAGVSYSGSATIDVVLHKTKNKVNADIDIYTPKETIHLSGQIQAPFPGDVNISTCPD